VVVADLDGAVRAMVGGTTTTPASSTAPPTRIASRAPRSSLCLRHRPDERLQADLGRGGRAGLHRQLVPAELRPQLFGFGHVDQAITRSINVVPVKLSIAMGGAGGPKAGRAKIVQTARRMGIKAPLPDTPSLPIGADEVTLLEHTVAYATFPNQGKAVKPHAILEVRSGVGDTIWRSTATRARSLLRRYPPRSPPTWPS